MGSFQLYYSSYCVLSANGPVIFGEQTQQMQNPTVHCFHSSPQLRGMGGKIVKVISTGCRTCVLTEHVPEKSCNASEPSL